MPDDNTPATDEQKKWRNTPLTKRLEILESGMGIPSFIDKATVDERIDWLKKEIAEKDAGKPRPDQR